MSNILTPYYRIVIKSTAQNITQYITQFCFEDSVEESDLLKLSFKGVPNSLIDNENFQEGTILQFNWGFLKGKASGYRLARITDIDYNYGKTVDVSIKALDVGFILKKGSKTFTWSDISIKGILKSIASKNGLKLEANGLVGGVDELETRIENNPQVALNDWDFLKKTLLKEGTGDFMLYCHDDKLIVKPRSLGKTSVVNFDYDQGRNNIISFKPKERDTRKDADSKKTEIKSEVDGSDDIVQQDSTSKNGKEKKLGANLVYYDRDGNEITKSTSEVQTEGQVNYPSSTPREATAKANKIRLDASLKDITATLVIQGDPNLFSDDIITMSGVADKHAGNWYIVKAKHAISQGGGYKTTLELNKNARSIQKVKGEEKVNKADVNNSIGANESQSKKEIKFVDYNEDGKLIKDR